MATVKVAQTARVVEPVVIPQDARTSLPMPLPAQATAPGQAPVEALRPVYAGDRIALVLWIGCALLLAGMQVMDLVRAVIGF